MFPYFTTIKVKRLAKLPKTLFIRLENDTTRFFFLPLSLGPQCKLHSFRKALAQFNMKILLKSVQVGSYPARRGPTIFIGRLTGLCLQSGSGYWAKISIHIFQSKKHDTGCKASRFYGLPFGQVVARIYQPKSLLSSPNKFFMSSIDYSSSAI